MMRERGIGRRRCMAFVAVLIALTVAAPELGGSAGAATPRSGNRTEMQSRPAARHELVARRKKRKKNRAALIRQHRARIRRYLRQHPELVRRHLQQTGRKIRADALRKKPRLVRAYLKAHPNVRRNGAGAPRRVKPAKPNRRRVVAVGAATAARNKKKQRSKAALAAAAKKQQQKKKDADKSHPLGLAGWGQILLLALLPLLAVAGLLFITDRLRQPPKPPKPPTPKRRRRTLVITPMNRNR